MTTYKRRKLTRKVKLLLGAASIFALGVATSVTATYAYFSLSEKNSIDNLNVRFSAEENTLELGVWDDSINDVSFSQESYNNKDLGMEETKLTDVSGMYESTWLNDSVPLETRKSRDFVPTFRGPYRGTLSVNDTRVATGGYIQHEFFLRSSNPCSIYLSSSSKVVPNDTNNTKTSNESGVLKEDLDEVVNASRISFYTYDSYTVLKPYLEKDKDKPYETKFGGIMDLNGDGYYDSRDGKELLYGEYETDSTHQVAYKSHNESPKEIARKNVFNANHKEGIDIVDFENTTVDIKKEKTITFDDMIIKEDEPDMDVSPITTLKKDEIKRIIVSIYLEGWDRNMTSSLYMASFDVNISFAALFNL